MRGWSVGLLVKAHGFTDSAPLTVEMRLCVLNRSTNLEPGSPVDVVGQCMRDVRHSWTLRLVQMQII